MGECVELRGLWPWAPSYRDGRFHDRNGLTRPTDRPGRVAITGSRDSENCHVNRISAIRRVVLALESTPDTKRNHQGAVPHTDHDAGHDDAESHCGSFPFCPGPLGLVFHVPVTPNTLSDSSGLLSLRRNRLLMLGASPGGHAGFVRRISWRKPIRRSAMTFVWLSRSIARNNCAKLISGHPVMRSSSKSTPYRFSMFSTASSAPVFAVAMMCPNRFLRTDVPMQPPAPV